MSVEWTFCPWSVFLEIYFQDLLVGSDQGLLIEFIIFNLY